MKNKRLNKLYYIFTPIFILTLATFMNLRKTSEYIYLNNPSNIEYNSTLKLENESKTTLNQNYGKKNNYEDKQANYKLFGNLTVKNSNEKILPKIKVYPGGQPVGIKLKTNGVLVVGLSDIQSENGNKMNPAVEGGIQIGDSIIKINNEPISDSKSLIDMVNKNMKLSITISRNGKDYVKTVIPSKCNTDGTYKLGIWVRDSTAGVGTLTFYDKETGKFAALGHPITDIDTGTLLKVKDGNIINSKIISIKKGVKGTPGEVRGMFIDEENSIGNIKNNTICGIYGNEFKMQNNDEIKPMEVGFRSEIKEGDAKILTTINQEKPKYYSIKIEKLLVQDSPGPKSMVIKITDPELLKKTGGIVQGMSGSPIIQNNKIVGAVTHVLINSPDTGYGIYAEWMIKELGLIS
ncbi:SpoIVB peptidase [Clostridium akagii]|uniref:SpoIVB peptidase n=1 Tax=Clostridium akagii TaxID=91623 RepID=UPI00047C79E9|nr:SpoIVB peptidase [Clostridium akagii]